MFLIALKLRVINLSSDVTIIESKSKIAILARNRIGSKSQFPCTTETTLSVVALAQRCPFMLPCCDEIQISAAPAPGLAFHPPVSAG